LQNLTISNIYIFASIASINSITLLSCIVKAIFEINIFVVMFSNILRRYLNNIFYNKLNVKNIIRFIINFFFVATINAFDSLNTKSLLDLIRIFDIYIFIAFSFVSHLTIR